MRENVLGRWTSMPRIDLIKEDNGQRPIINRVVSYIDDKYYYEISLKTLAAMFKVNAAYLGRLFKNETGEIFSYYLNNVRIEKAKQMLMETSLSAKKVAVRVGYTNSNYFYEVFKKFTGVYPTQYRNYSCRFSITQ